MKSEKIGKQNKRKQLYKSLLQQNLEDSHASSSDYDSSEEECESCNDENNGINNIDANFQYNEKIDVTPPSFSKKVFSETTNEESHKTPTSVTENIDSNTIDDESDKTFCPSSPAKELNEITNRYDKDSVDNERKIIYSKDPITTLVEDLEYTDVLHNIIPVSSRHPYPLFHKSKKLGKKGQGFSDSLIITGKRRRIQRTFFSPQHEPSRRRSRRPDSLKASKESAQSNKEKKQKHLDLKSYPPTSKPINLKEVPRDKNILNSNLQQNPIFHQRKFSQEPHKMNSILSLKVIDPAMLSHGRNISDSKLQQNPIFDQRKFSQEPHKMNSIGAKGNESKIQSSSISPLALKVLDPAMPSHGRNISDSKLQQNPLIDDGKFSQEPNKMNPIEVKANESEIQSSRISPLALKAIDTAKLSHGRNVFDSKLQQNPLIDDGKFSQEPHKMNPIEVKANESEIQSSSISPLALKVIDSAMVSHGDKNVDSNLQPNDQQIASKESHETNSQGINTNESEIQPTALNDWIDQEIHQSNHSSGNEVQNDIYRNSNLFENQSLMNNFLHSSLASHNSRHVVNNVTPYFQQNQTSMIPQMHYNQTSMIHQMRYNQASMLPQMHYNQASMFPQMHFNQTPFQHSSQQMYNYSNPTYTNTMNDTKSQNNSHTNGSRTSLNITSNLTTPLPGSQNTHQTDNTYPFSQAQNKTPNETPNERAGTNCNDSKIQHNHVTINVTFPLPVTQQEPKKMEELTDIIHELIKKKSIILY